MILIFITIFVPDIVLIPQVPAFKLVDLFLIFLLFKVLVDDRFKGSGLIFNNKLLLIFIFLIVSAMISISSQFIIKSSEIIFKDFMIIFQIIKYFIIFSFAQSIKIDKNQYKSIMYTFLITGFLVSIFGLFQFFNIFHINEWLTPIFAGKEMQFHQIVDGNYIQGRIVGVGSNPNYYGYILNTIMCFVIVYMLSIRKIIYKLIVLSTLVIMVIALGLTISRSALISVMFILLVTFLFYKSVANKSKLFWSFFMILLAFFIFSTYFRSESYDERIQFASTSTQRSIHARIRDFKRPFDRNLNSLTDSLLGLGPSKVNIRTDSHNEFGWYFLRFGLLGLAIYLALIFKILKTAFKKYKNCNLYWAKALYFSCFLVFCNFILYCFSGNKFKMPRIMTLTFLVAGVTFARSIRGISKNIINSKIDLR